MWKQLKMHTTNSLIGYRAPIWASLLLGLFLGAFCSGQDSKFSKGGFSDGGFGNLELPTVDSDAPPVVFGANQPASLAKSLQFKARYQLEEQGQGRGRLIIKAELADGYHTYSTTQPPGGPYATSFSIASKNAQITGDFQPDRDPKLGKDEAAYGDLILEEFYDSVVWTAPIQLAEGLDPRDTVLEVKADALVCRQACEPIKEQLEAAFDGYYSANKTVESLRVERTHAVWQAKLRPSQVAPGQQAVLELTATNDPGYHVYEFVPNDEEVTFRTLIVAKRKSGLKFGTPTTDANLETFPGLDDVRYYGGEVTWSIPVHIPATAQTGELPIELMVGFTTCNEGSCDEPSGLLIEGSVQVAEQSSNEIRALSVSASDFKTVADLPMLASWIDFETGQVPSEGIAAVDDASQAAAAETQPLTLFHILAALAGGFILNFMPCVLPVIGLKVMSFVNQAGNSHRRVVSLNLAYVAGILAVMLVLAGLTVAAKLASDSAFGWGEQFTHLEFKVVLACLVFAMALSFLGVWEIPIPGFATSSKSGELMEKEGMTGAFLKGVLTTVLATPCSGPLLGSLFGLSLVLSPINVILLYVVVGLGMALPFLVLCFYPGFIRMLPKPGAWMETLKQALAFPLLLTAVFFVASIDDEHRIATLILLIIVWFACWLIGRIPAYADSSKRRLTWALCMAVIGLGAFMSFRFFGPLDSDLEWVDYNETQLAQYRAEGKTVMLDFTANWCLNCQINTRVAIDKEGVAKLVQQNGVIPMLADWTDRSDEIREKLEELQSNSIPLLVIYPPDASAEPILLRDLLTESQVIAALEEAGPSRSKQKLASVIH